MLSRDYANNSRQVMLSGGFTMDEMEKLNDLRANYTTHAEYLERVIEDRRMEFVRFLMQHGRLNEGFAEA